MAARNHDAKDWSSNANDAFQIRLQHSAPANPKHDVSFQPAFTYPIFGEEETIFGYQGLKIKLAFAADTLRPQLDVQWKQQYVPVGDTKADEVEGRLVPFLPTLYNEGDDLDHATFAPPGELVHKYHSQGRAFGIWSTLLTDARAKQLLRNMQIFIPLFIEGGTLIELDDPEWTIARWTVFFVYAIDKPSSESQNPTYSFVGYSTAYRLFFLDITDPSKYTLPSDDPSATKDLPTEITSLSSQLPSRERISQFLILPPYQSAGHGSQLYTTILKRFISSLTIKEITVEDPNESFDDLRDINDLIHLRRNQPAFASLSINPTVRITSKAAPLPTDALVSQDKLKTLRTTSKIAPRQFARLSEMQLLSKIPPRHRQVARITRKDRASDPQDVAYFYWRLLVKARLYKHNVDVLAQLDVEERIEKLEETLGGVERDYERLLEAVDKRERREAVAVAGAEEGVELDGKAGGILGANGDDMAVAMAARGKRRRIVDEDDDDDDDDDDGEARGTPARKLAD